MREVGSDVWIWTVGAEMIWMALSCLWKVREVAGVVVAGLEMHERHGASGKESLGQRWSIASMAYSSGCYLLIW